MLCGFTCKMCIYGGGRGQRKEDLCPGAISGILCVALVFALKAKLLLSLLDITFVSVGMEEVLALADEFPLAIFDVLGDGIDSNVDLSPSCEKPGTVLIGDFQYDSY